MDDYFELHQYQCRLCSFLAFLVRNCDRYLGVLGCGYQLPSEKMIIIKFLRSKLRFSEEIKKLA